MLGLYPENRRSLMQTLKIVPDTHSSSKINSRNGNETGSMEDKLACMLTYLRSLERNAEELHQDNEDWRYGRYLVYGIMLDALKRADRPGNHST
jgi:hypothetical protein